MPINPGGGDNNKSVEYVYLGCDSSTDISTAKNKYQLSNPKPGTSTFRNLYDLVNNTIGSFGFEFSFTEAGIFFISSPLSSSNRIKVKTLKGYRTGGLPSGDILGYEIFCDKDNNILFAEKNTNIEGTNAPVFWAINTNIPTE